MTILRFLIFIVMLLPGCGFHLVNSGEAIAVCINGSEQKQIKKILKTVCTKKSYQLEVKSFAFRQNGINSSANANLKQSELEQYIIFDLLNYKHEPIEIDIKLSVNKPMLTNNNAILSSNLEQELIQKEMQRSLINQLSRYLRSKIPNKISSIK